MKPSPILISIPIVVRSDSACYVERFDTDADFTIIAERDWERIPKTEEKWRREC